MFPQVIRFTGLGLLLLLAACLAGPSQPPPGGVELIRGRAAIEALEVAVLESYPVQVRVLARGYLADACTEIERVLVDGPAEGRFRIAITTVRPARAICAQMVKPFERAIPLETAGLPPGHYLVEANGLRRSFLLEAR